MSSLLHIETSTDICSVAVSGEGECVYNREGHGGHSEILGTFIDEAFAFVEGQGMVISAVAVSSGPGSYTGLRIGVSMAKGICYGLGVPLISVSTLELLCVPLLLRDQPIEDDALLCPMIDARRMEVYAGIYDKALRTVRDVRADIVDETTYREYLAERPVYFFGNGALKCREKISHPNARFIEGAEPLAKWMFPLAEKKIREGKTENVAYFVPHYLKEFVAGKPKPII